MFTFSYAALDNSHICSEEVGLPSVPIMKNNDTQLTMAVDNFTVLYIISRVYT